MRASSRRPQAALAAIALLMFVLGVGAYVYESWTEERGAATARAGEPESLESK